MGFELVHIVGNAALRMVDHQILHTAEITFLGWPDLSSQRFADAGVRRCIADKTNTEITHQMQHLQNSTIVMRDRTKNHGGRLCL